MKKYIPIVVIIFAIGFFVFLKTITARAASIDRTDNADYNADTVKSDACISACPAPGECQPTSIYPYEVQCSFPTCPEANCAADQYCAQTLASPSKFYCKKLDTPAPSSLDNLMNDLNARRPILEINIPGLNFSNVASTTDDSGTYFYIAWIPELISALYKFGIAIVSIVAVVVIIIQGMRVVTSAGGEAKTSAYKRIGQAIVGLMIAWGSFAILYNINPALVQFNALKVQVVQNIPFDDSDTLSDLSPEEAALVASGSGCDGLSQDTQNVLEWGGVPLIKQTDPSWHVQSRCGLDPNNIAKSGCGPTSLSMVMAKYMGINNQPNPLVLEQRFYEAGARKGRGTGFTVEGCGVGSTGGWANKNVLGDFLHQDVWNIKNPKERIIQLLEAHKPIIVGVKALSIFTGGGHYIVLTGINADGTLKVNDPMKCTYNCTALLRKKGEETKCVGKLINPPLTGDSIPQDYVFPFMNQAHYIYPADDYVPPAP